MSHSKPIIFIMAGGTGGHVFPGLALAERLAKDYAVHWLGTQKGIEFELVNRQYPLHLFEITGLRGHGWNKYLKAPLIILRATAFAYRIFKALKPKVVVGFGGFVSGPGGLAAIILKIPLFIHEQNAIAGTTNKFLHRFSKKSFAAYPKAFKACSKVHVVGNPLRHQLNRPFAPRIPFKVGESFNILVLGGSRGALKINQVMPEMLSLLSDQIKIYLTHQTGISQHAECLKRYQELGLKVNVIPFIEDMVAAYQSAHLVIARAGALTLSEINQMGKPSLLIPYPYASDNHQALNANYQADQGASLVLENQALEPKSLAWHIQNFYHNPTYLDQMSDAAKRLAKPKALDDLVDIISEHFIQ